MFVMEGKLCLADYTTSPGQQFILESESYHDDFSCGGGDCTRPSKLRYFSGQL